MGVMHDVDREIAPCSRCGRCRFPDTRLAANSGDSGIDDRCYFVPTQGVAGEEGRTVATVIPADGAADDIHHRFEILDRRGLMLKASLDRSRQQYLWRFARNKKAPASISRTYS